MADPITPPKAEVPFQSGTSNNKDWIKVFEDMAQQINDLQTRVAALESS